MKSKDLSFAQSFYKKWVQRSFPKISLTMAFFVLAQFSCWAVHDGLQEWLFKKEGYSFGGFMAFALQACCIIGSAVEIAVASRGQQQQELNAAKRRSYGDLESGGQGNHDADAEPHLYTSWKELFMSVPAHYALLGLVIALSNGLATAALSYVSQPVKVLFKSSKLVPVMAFRAVLGNVSSNSWREYLYALSVCAGVAIFTVADQTSSKQVKSHVIGLLMLTGSVCADAIAPNLQERLLRKHHQPKASLMFHTNWISAAMTLFFLVPSGEGHAAVMWLWNHPKPARGLLIQSSAGALGVAAYVGCIQYAGSKTTVLVTSTRKMFTIAISFLFISRKAFTGKHFVGLLLAVTGIMGSGMEEADAKGKKAAPGHHHHGSSGGGMGGGEKGGAAGGGGGAMHHLHSPSAHMTGDRDHHHETLHGRPQHSFEVPTDPLRS